MFLESLQSENRVSSAIREAVRSGTILWFKPAFELFSLRLSFKNLYKMFVYHMSTSSTSAGQTTNFQLLTQPIGNRFSEEENRKFD